eukprot:CAMPEP_0114584220 /NCGR_PEP_ID=MMETSP0125-20121206/7935_1 /TAXON_ID=485358 ORGANISM="Aristerostoma sp., Strain ATCC 50986" /NCGR_SAMPLE_ID=MMETSP0125 /ASSEMBLY_ACC=CAM_ASM_000245 /LENGTH=76 /DNA_ID=CAMNT_0001778423 /DNA_START=311 /DNA_END=538 /DNA_ORIENTATION=+
MTASAGIGMGLKSSSSAKLKGVSSANRQFSGNMFSASSIRREDGVKTIEDPEYEYDDLGIQEDFEEDDEVYRDMER